MASEAEICREQVWERPGYWHSHACGKKAKWWVRNTEGLLLPVCRIHANKHERRGKVIEPMSTESEGRDVE